MMSRPSQARRACALSLSRSRRPALTAALLALTAAAQAAPYAPADHSGTLHVIIENARSARGNIHVDICPQADFLSRCPYSAEATARKGRVEVVVRGVPPGRYAAQITHDENGNKKVDRGLLGIPREGIGFSNNVRVRFSAPRFADAAFTVTGGKQSITVNLQYFGGSGS
jgi:uncharacterized protein (DUF2141 family)